MKCRITGFDKEGFGLCRSGGRTLKVQNSIIGEEVVIEKIHNDTYLAKEILDPSPHRVKPKCSYFNECGGCRWQHMSYQYQIEMKRKIIEKIFGREDISVIESPRITNYRGKGEFTFGNSGGRVILGFNKIKSYYQVVDVDECILLPREFKDIVQWVREFVNREGFSAYDKREHRGFLRYLILRKGFNTGDILMNIITTSQGVFPLKNLLDGIDVDIKSASWSIRDSVGDFARGEIKEVIGESTITEKINDKIFYIGPYTFFQANPFVAEKMVEIVSKESGYGALALDIYSGVGLFSLNIAERYEKVIAIEYDEETVNLGLKSSAFNNIENVEFRRGLAEQVIHELLGNKPDLVVVDPPRSGLHRKVVRGLIRMKPGKIIYVSCNPYTSGRDVSFLQRGGYTVNSITMIDQFPHTPHVELIIILERKNQ